MCCCQLEKNISWNCEFSSHSLPKFQCLNSNHISTQNATGHAISIPMPGHPIPSSDAALSQAKADVGKLEKLFDEHDAVFLLMDSRESRWLPTVLGAAKGKVCPALPKNARR